MIRSIRREEHFWNNEHVLNNLILHLWTHTKLVIISLGITNPSVTKSMLLKTLEDFTSPLFFESLNVFFSFNKHKHHIMHVIQDCLSDFNIFDIFHCTQPWFSNMPCTKEDGDVLQHNLNCIKYAHINTLTINICYISKYIVTFMEWKILEIIWLGALFNKHN